MGWQDAPVVGTEPSGKVSIGNAWELAPLVRENVAAEPADARREMVQRELTTAIAPFAGAYTGVGNIVLGGQKLLGQGLTALGAKDTGQFLTEDAIRRQELQKQFIQPYKDVAPGYAGTGEFAGEVLATLPVGGFLAKPIQAVGQVIPKIASVVTPLAQSLRSGGFQTGIAPTTFGAKTGNVLAKIAGGATVGGVSSALINPDETSTGVGVGAVAPFVVPTAAKYIAIAGGKVIDAATGNLAKVESGKIAQEAAGDFINQIRAANNIAPLDINAAQAAYGINNDVYQAFLSYVSGKDLKSVLSGIKTKQGKDQFDILANLARGATETEAKTNRGLAKETLNKLTTPMREENILAANVGKNVMMPLQQEADLARQAAAANVQDVRRFAGAQTRAISPAPTNLATDANLANLANRADETAAKAAAESLAQGEIARIAETKIADLTANGVQPLNINSVNNRLSTLANQVGTRADPIQVTVLTKLKGRLQDLAQANGGVIDANDLYQLRKTGINDVIEAELRSGGLDPSTQSQRIASLLGDIRPLVDDAIEKAGGNTWRDYLSTHAAGMKQIEQLEMADKLRTLFSQDKNTFVRMVEGNDTKAIQEIFGPGNFNIAEQMAEKIKPLLKIKDEIVRDAKIEEQIKAGSKALSELKEINKPSFASFFPGFVGTTTAVAKKVTQTLEGKVSAKTVAILADAAKSGKSMNEILNTLPADERFKIIKAFKDISNVAQAGAASLITPPPTNALAPQQQQNQNALAR